MIAVDVFFSHRDAYVIKREIMIMLFNFLVKKIAGKKFKDLKEIEMILREWPEFSGSKNTGEIVLYDEESEIVYRGESGRHIIGNIIKK